MRHGLSFSFYNGLTWLIALGTPMVLLGQQLGASTTQVGLLYAFVFLVLPLQVMATSLLRVLGYRRQMVIGWTLRSVFLLVPLALALKAPQTPQPWMLTAFVWSVFFFCIFRAIGGTAHVPWLYALLPAHTRGRFFARDQVVSGVCGVLTLLTCAALFRVLPTYEAFAVQYGVAILGSALSIYCLTRMPDAPKPKMIPLGRVFSEAPALCLRKGPFRFYLTLCLLTAVIDYGFVAFLTYYLKTEVRMGSDFVLLLAAIQYGGSLIGGWLIGRWIDRHGVRPFFKVPILVMIGVQLYWVGFVTGHLPAGLPLALTFAAVGFAGSCTAIAHLKYLPCLAQDEDRPLMVSVQTAVVGFLGGLSPVLWGLLLKDADATGGPRMNVGAFVGYLTFACAMKIGLFSFYGRLRDERDVPRLQLPGGVLQRPFRYLASLIDLVEPPAPEQKRAPGDLP